MNNRTAAVDDYIARSAPFAQPILEHLRELVHQACPAVEESIKWSHPHFTYRGMLCGVAAFKQHCAFGFWKHKQIFGDDLAASDAAMGQFGRITSLEQLPPDAELLALVRRAAAFNESGRQAASPAKRRPRPPPSVPDDLAAALAGNAAASDAFARFSVTDRRDYIEWLTEAKTAATRDRRLQQAIDWIAEGKSRNWKYARAK